MKTYATIESLKSIEALLPFNEDVFNKFILNHCESFPNAEQMAKLITQEVKLTVFSGISLDDLIESAILVATQNIQNDINFDSVAARLQISKIYKYALKNFKQYDDFAILYKDSFKEYIKYGIEQKLLNTRMGEGFDMDELASALVSDRDDIYKYIGISTALKRYLKLDWDQNPLETPQFMWMRIAMWMAIEEKDREEKAIMFYKKLSKLEYIPGGSTNIGAGTNYPVLSNCYLIDTEDDIHSIFDNVKHVALISKATGGIGISVTKLRAAGSPVRSNNTFSTGPIPFIKVMDAALKSVSRAGKKAGAMCVYMENWHLDFPDFLDLRQNAGDDYRRVRTADTAVYISDEFMKRVINNETWYMFDPLETPDLPELYGYEFSKKYAEYCEKAEQGQIKLFKKVPAREQMKRIMASMLGTSHPWLTWKDNINLRALNNNSGTIHCSNLCTEICLPQDRDNIAVCNLAYINLTNHVIAKETTDVLNKKAEIDWDRLEETVRVSIRHLDNLIDVNHLTVEEAKKSDQENRAVGLGMSGYAETLELFGYAYDSLEAYELMDRVMEFITYHAIDESCNLAEERGAYKNFPGSMWSKGFVPFDTIEKVALDRLGKPFTESNVKSQVKDTLEKVRERIQNGMKNSSSEESKELFAIFEQLTGLINQNAQSREAVSETEEELTKVGRGIELRQNRSMTMNWDKLRERVKKGIRNATTMAIAPNASTGLVLGTTPGIDVRFSQIFSRATSTGKFLDINPNLVRDLQKLGIWEEVKDQLIESYGDVELIDKIPDQLKRIYKTSFQVSPYATIEVASRAQKWIDQAMSRNMYLETRDVNELVDIYVEAWRRGIKTTYYLHTKPRHTAEQSTIKVNKAKKINKSGFASVVQRTTQPSLDGQLERRGFGFAVTGVATPASTNSQEGDTTQTNAGSGSVGFANIQDPKIENKLNFKPAKELPPGFACPIDPAERAQCEACQ